MPIKLSEYFDLAIKKIVAETAQFCKIREPEERVELSFAPYHGAVLPFKYSGFFSSPTIIFLSLVFEK